MRLVLTKKEFLNSWEVAERCIDTSSKKADLNAILIEAEPLDGVTLKSTDCKKSMVCVAEGVSVEEPGSALLPVATLSELMKKIPSETMDLIVDDNGVGYIKSGKNKYKFSTYPTERFPIKGLTIENKDAPVCKITACDLHRLIAEGSIAASMKDEPIIYLGCVCVDITEDKFNIVSTDSKWLACSSANISSTSKVNGLLSAREMKELAKIAETVDEQTEFSVYFDETKFAFCADGIEFTLRLMNGKFPKYERLLAANTSSTGSVMLNRKGFLSALERIALVVKDFDHRVSINYMANDEESFVLRGSSPTFGEAQECLYAKALKNADVSVAANVKFFVNIVKALKAEEIQLNFSGSLGNIFISPYGEGSNFIALVAPMHDASTSGDKNG